MTLLIPDTNLLVYAMRADVPQHRATVEWFDEIFEGEDEIGLVDFVLHGSLRVTSITRFFSEPSLPSEGLTFIASVTAAPNAVRLFASAGTWPIFEGLLSATSVTGNDIPDAYLAALAIEHDAVLCSADRGFARFPGLRHLNPLDA